MLLRMYCTYTVNVNIFCWPGPANWTTSWVGDPLWFNPDPDPAFFLIVDPHPVPNQGCDGQNLKKMYSCKTVIYFFDRKLQVMVLILILQNMKILNFFLYLCVIFAPGSRSGSAFKMRIRIQQLKFKRIRIHNPDDKCPKTCSFVSSAWNEIPLLRGVFFQGCGSVSWSAWIRINLSCWIRIQEGKNDSQKKKKVKKFHVLNCWMFSFESWRLLL